MNARSHFKNPLVAGTIALVVFSTCSFALVFRLALEGDILEAAPQKKPVERPRVVTPGVGTKPPSDAIVLFDGTNLDEFTKGNGDPAAWDIKTEPGVMTIPKGGGSIYTKRKFGDIQLHLEFRAPKGSKKGESKGNSGLKLHNAYEVQILDNYENTSNSLGQCASVYKQHRPYVNACRPPGEWQTYDIIFRAPYWDEDGDVIQFGRFTVIHNGVVVQDNSELWDERTNNPKPGPSTYKESFFIQDHGSPVSFRNIWVRELERKPPQSQWKKPGWRKKAKNEKRK